VVADRRSDRLDDATGGAVALGEGASEGGVLAGREPARRVPGPRAEDGADRQRHVLRTRWDRPAREVRAGEHPVPGDDRRLASVHSLQGGDGVWWEGLRAFDGEGQLDVQHHARCSPGDGGRRGMQPHAPSGPYGQGQGRLGRQALQENEGRQLAHPPAGLGAPGYQPVDRTRCPGRRGGRFGDRDDLDQNPAGLAPPRLHVRPGHQDDRADGVRQVIGGHQASDRDPDPEAAPAPAGGLRDRGESRRPVAAEVDDAQRIRPAGRDGEPGIGEFERTDGKDDVPRGRRQWSPEIAGPVARHTPPSRLG
jgi:hypothetical protein